MQPKPQNRQQRPWLAVASCFVIAGLALPIEAAPPAPATMVLEGEIHSSSGVRPEASDPIIAFALDSGQPVGNGTVSTGGYYTAVIARPSSLNGSFIVLELQRGNRRYALIDEIEGYAGTRFQGRLLPERIWRSFSIGRQTATLKTAETADVQAQRLVRSTDLPCTEDTDLNHDGRCDAEDEALAALYGGGIFRVVGQP